MVISWLVFSFSWLGYGPPGREAADRKEQPNDHNQQLTN